LLTPSLPQQSTLLAADGTKIATVYLRNRIAVPLKDMSITMRHAIIATEDARFYEHRGWTFGARSEHLSQICLVVEFRAVPLSISSMLRTC
jgi:membrane peptidoglycan carboxypeptidase